MRIKDTSGEVLQRVSGSENNSAKKADAAKTVESGISQIKDDGFELAKVVESINQNQGKESEVSGKKTGLTGGLKLKVASESMLPADAAIKNRDSESTKTSEQKGSKELSFDQTVLAGNPNLDDIHRSAYEMIDGRANYESQKDQKKPGGKSDSKKDPQQEFNSQRNLQGSPEQSGATGPDVSEVVNQLASGDFSIPPRDSSELIPGIKGQARTKDELKEGASGNALLDSANEHDRKGPSYGQGMIADGKDALGAFAIATSVGSMGVLDVAVAASSTALVVEGAAVLAASGGVVVAAAAGVAFGTVVDKAYEAISGQSLGADIADATTGTETKEETEKKAEQARKEAAEKKAKEEAAQGGQSTEGQSTEQGKTTKDPGGYEDYEGNIPDFIKQQGQKFVNDLRAIGPHKGGEDIDPAEQSEPKGQIVNDPQIHLGELGKFGLFAQPDTTQQFGGSGGTFTESPQSGGDVDLGPDSPNHGYTGPTRGGDPSDMNINVGATPLIGLGSKSKDDDEEEQHKGTKKKK